MSRQMGFPSFAPSEKSQDFEGVIGLCYRPGLLDSDEQSRLLQQIDMQPWRDDLKRRVQHYGYRYDYKTKKVDYSMYLGALPPFALVVANKLLAQGLITEMPDQAIVNEYEPGQGISPHVDCEPCFRDTIVTVSLGWAYEMEFTRLGSKTDKRFVMLEAGSALVMRGEARYQWLHEIKQRKVDRGIPRQRRVSLTFRNVILEHSAPHSS